MIIIFSSISFYTGLNVYAGNENFLDLTGLNDTESYNQLYLDEHNTVTNPDSGFVTSSSGADLIFGAGYTSLKNILSGNWLVITSNIFVTSLGFAPIDPLILGILITLLGLIFLLIVLGAIMNRVFIQR